MHSHVDSPIPLLPPQILNSSEQSKGQFSKLAVHVKELLRYSIHSPLCLNSDFEWERLHIGYSTSRKVATDANSSTTILKQNQISAYHKAA